MQISFTSNSSFRLRNSSSLRRACSNLLCWSSRLCLSSSCNILVKIWPLKLTSLKKSKNWFAYIGYIFCWRLKNNLKLTFLWRSWASCLSRSLLALKNWLSNNEKSLKFLKQKKKIFKTITLRPCFCWAQKVAFWAVKTQFQTDSSLDFFTIFLHLAETSAVCKKKLHLIHQKSEQ